MKPVTVGDNAFKCVVQVFSLSACESVKDGAGKPVCDSLRNGQAGTASRRDLQGM
jgi:hypothetical protein